MQTINLPKSRQKEMVIQELPDEVLIYDLKTNKAFCLNHTAAFIWQHADGATPIGQIAYLLQKKLRTPVDESVIWFALERFSKDGLMENKIVAPMIFSGMNRRDLIKTLGKSTAVALPLVMAITAPLPAAAQSAATCRQTGESCGGVAGTCCSGNSCLNFDTCCRDSGTSCTSNSQCCPGESCGSFATCCRPNGASCSSNIQCCSGTCSGGLGCISIGIGGCVLYDTPIITADGSTVKAIDVFVGQELLGVNCINGEKIAGRVKAMMKHSAEGFYSITAESGDTIQCSPDHPLINGFGDKWGKHARKFQTGDALLIYDDKKRQIVEAKTVEAEFIKVPQPVIIFEMDTVEHTFVSGGIVSHNLVLK